MNYEKLTFETHVACGASGAEVECGGGGQACCVRVVKRKKNENQKSKK